MNHRTLYTQNTHTRHYCANAISIYRSYIHHIFITLRVTNVMPSVCLRVCYMHHFYCACEFIEEILGLGYRVDVFFFFFLCRAAFQHRPSYSVFHK